jgi:N utilization substance protein B
MSSEHVDFKKHRDFIYFLIEGIIVDDDFLSQVVEERSIFWNDDIDFATGMAIKTIGKFKASKPVSMFPMFKDDEDRMFMVNLFRKTVLNREETRNLIKKFTKNWDFERIAIMDILIMEMAITEAMEFSSIPTRVTLNEYIEIAKFYSTEKSSVFINGILDKTFQELKSENKIKKRGRGLIGENN